VTRKTRVAVTGGTVVVLTGLAVAFQVLQFEFGTPARAGTHAAPPADTGGAEPPSPEASAPTDAVRLRSPAPAEPAPPRSDPQTTLLQPVPVVPAAPEPPRRVTAARWPLADPAPPGPQAGSWSRPQPLESAAPVQVAESARPAPAAPPHPALVRPMPAAAAAPRHHPEARAMARPLTGTHACLLADDGTLQLPAGVRRQLEAPARRTLFVTPGPDQALWLFTGPGLERWAADADRAGSARGREARRRCLAQTEACTVDRSGRLRLPEHLARFAGLCQEVVLLGVGDHLELWDAGRWQQQRER
jgi:MraZ protein